MLDPLYNVQYSQFNIDLDNQDKMKLVSVLLIFTVNALKYQTIFSFCSQ